MLYAVGSPLPEYRLRAFNNTIDHRNPIYEDECARRFGYRAGLVSGASIYAFVCRSLIEFVGKDWLQRGSTDIQFVHPTYEGEELRTTGNLTSVTKDGSLFIEYKASNPQGVVCACGVARLPIRPPAPEPTLRNYPAGKQKIGRPISMELLKIGENLTPITSQLTRTSHWEYCRKNVRDHNPLYQEVLHPGWLFSQSINGFAANYDLPPWILVSSSVQKYHWQEHECVVEIRGSVKEKFEHKGHHFVVLDIALFAAKRCLETNRHTIIFRIAPRAA